MRNEGVGSWIFRRARMTPSRPAFVYGEGAVTYAEASERVARLAHALIGLGVSPGDRVAYLGPNHPAFLETLFATATLGAVFVPLNFRLAPPELLFNVRDAGVTVLVAAKECAPAAAVLAEEPGIRHFVSVDEGYGGKDYERLIASASHAPIDHPVGLDDTCMIMYTSGTTGRPKGAILSHGNATWNAVNVLIDIDLGSDEVSLVSAPLFHTAALNMLTLPTLMKGGTAVLVGAFDPVRTLSLIERHRVTFMFGVPAMFRAVADAPGFAEADLSSVRVLMCGGAPVPESLIRIYEKRGLVFLQGYGMTETAPGALFLSRQNASRIGSAGKASFFTDVRLARPDLSTPAPLEPGEVLVQGPNVIKGYWANDDASRAAFTDGWFRSGDAAVVDEEGFFYIRDRIKDLIISGGENIYPAEVEAVLCQHPAVLECAVIGVPDERWGEVGKAVIVPRSGVAAEDPAFLAFFEGKVARYKIPKTLEIADALPRTGSGKVDKKALRARYGGTPSSTPPAGEKPR